MVRASLFVILLVSSWLPGARLARASGGDGGQGLAQLSPRPKELTLDVDALSVAVTYAAPVGDVLIGGGIGGGPSPLVGGIWARGAHFATNTHGTLLELAQLQLFGRFALASWMTVDAGLRAGWFIHGSEDFSGGTFAAVYVAPAVGWRWIWAGPRVSAGVLRESGVPTSTTLMLDGITLRFVKRW